jgi:hypothetical protein
MKTSDSIRTFLAAQRGSDLIDFYLAHPGLETQVNVAAGDGWPVEGRIHCYTDGLNDWWPIRIPKQASSEPHWYDYELKWPLEIHAEGIGSTGWQWTARRSLYVGFDFDSILGHAAGVGVSDDRLLAIRNAAQALPWVQVQKSTGGAGLHLYVFFDGIPTTNHTEHAALARSVLTCMSAETGFDFAANIDACGSNMWLWRRDQAVDGLKLIKRATATFSPASNWRDRVEARTPTIRGTGNLWDGLALAYRPVPLDHDHRKHIDMIAELGFTATWDADKHLLTTHTLGFKRLAEKLPIRGCFDTIAPGRHPGEPNCFAFPDHFGTWHVYRFNKGIAEAPTWKQDRQGYTRCTFNAG